MTQVENSSPMPHKKDYVVGLSGRISEQFSGQVLGNDGARRYDDMDGGAFRANESLEGSVDVVRCGFGRRSSSRRSAGRQAEAFKNLPRVFRWMNCGKNS